MTSWKELQRRAQGFLHASSQEDAVKTISRKRLTDATHTEHLAQKDKANANEPSTATRNIPMLDMTNDDINAKLRKKVRLDNIAVSANRSAPGLRKLKVTVIEIGVSDTGYHDEMKKKQDQHKTLCSLLKQEDEDEFLPVVFGTKSSILMGAEKAMTALGDCNMQKTRILKKLHIHAIRCLHNIVKQRRQMENHRCTNMQSAKNRTLYRNTNSQGNSTKPGRPAKPPD